MGIYAGGGYGSRGPEKLVMKMGHGNMRAEAMEGGLEACHGNEARGIYGGGGYGGRGPEKPVVGMRPWGYMQAEAVEVGVLRSLSWE